MEQVRGLEWNREQGRRTGGRVLPILLSAALLATLLPSALAEPADPSQEWIVSGTPGALTRVVEAVERAGGRVVLPLGIVDGVLADLTAGQASAVSLAPGVRSVIPDAQVRLEAAEWKPNDQGAVDRVGQVIRSQQLRTQGVDGSGIDIALIDSGVAPVPGLKGPDKLVYGADLSFDSQAENLRYLDLFGHGTHLASIIAGRDGGRRGYEGVAPGARIVSVKVADGAGRADVSQVIAAIDWVVQHRHDNDLDVRVLALAFGTDSSQDPLIDPLSHAAEVAWRNGIVVLAAAGNDGNSAALRNPAHDPYLISVGAVETRGTPGTGDDTVLSFSNCGTEDRPVDVLAPGRSLIGLRVPNSFIDTFHPEGRLGDRFFRGTGTSQALAVTTGAVSLLLDQRPDLTPDQVKALLSATAREVRGAPGNCSSAGLLDLHAASRAGAPDAVQDWPESTGVGSLEAARGSHHIGNGDDVLEGEQDIFGVEWDGEAWATRASASNSWSGGVWNGSVWTGDDWESNSWSSNSWSSNSWSSNSWSSNSWSSNSWSSNSWSSNSWSSNSWSSNSWSSNSWSSNSWSFNAWSTTIWG